MIYCVFSSNRPGNVEKMERFFEEPPVWCVPDGQQGTYRQRTTGPVLPVVSKCLSEQRQYMLDYARRKHEPLLSTDDDLRRLDLLNLADQSKAPISLNDAGEMIYAMLRESRLKYGGTSTTGNAFFVKKALHFDKFVSGSLTVTMPDCQVDYDLKLRIKADIDFTIQNIVTHGGALRYDTILSPFAYKTGKGGVMDYRTPAMEREHCQYLLAKWPQYLRRNPKKPGEVAFR